MNIVTLGDVASNCGPNPCGIWDYISPSPECDTWQMCAAQQNAGVPQSTGCVVGGLDDNGDTIVNCPSAPSCLMGSGPLQSGQAYCSGVLDAAQYASAQYLASQQAPASVGFPQWAVLGLVVVGLVLVTRR